VTTVAQEKSQSVANSKKSPVKSALISPIESKQIVKVCQLELQEEFKCSDEDLFRAFTVPEMIQAFTNGSSQVGEPQVGGLFKLYGGMVQGCFKELVPNKHLAMDWRMSKWPEGHYSWVVINISRKADCTELKLNHHGVPEAERDEVVNGWKRQYFEAIKAVFGFGARLF